jgi:hypothetical protein
MYHLYFLGQILFSYQAELDWIRLNFKFKENFPCNSSSNSIQSELILKFKIIILTQQLIMLSNNHSAITDEQINLDVR